MQKYSIFTCIQKLNIKSKLAENKGKEGEDDWNLYFSVMQYLKELKDLKKAQEVLGSNKEQLNIDSGNDKINSPMNTTIHEDIKNLNNER